MFNFQAPEIDWAVVAPTMIVSLTGVIALIIEMFQPKRNNNLIVAVCLLGMLAAGVMTVVQFGYPETSTFGEMVIRDRFGLVLQLILIVSGALCILFSEGYLREKRIPYGEFYPLILWCITGAMVICSTRNMLMLFLGVEVLSVSLYVLAGMSRAENKSEEAALKYFLLGAFASGFLLYGIAFLYGATGSLQMEAISRTWAVADTTNKSLLVLGLGLVLIGISFKSAFVPFHQWTPDVYQGAPTNVSAFMAAGAKVGGLAALWRLLEGSGALMSFWLPALFWIAIVTMLVGNMVALVQKDIKRVLGYSSIAHAGYILVAILAHFKDPAKVGIGTVLFYLFSYALMTIGAFAVLSISSKGGKDNSGFDQVRGLWKRSPFAAGALIVFMASLIGIPGTSGFVGKFMIFGDALNAGLAPLAFVLAISSIISLPYYLQVAKAMFVDESEEEIKPMRLDSGLAVACGICLIGIFAGFILVSPILGVLTQ